MARLEAIGSDALVAAGDIMTAAYADIIERPLRNTTKLTELRIGQVSICGAASDAVTRAAYSLGIYAAREVHPLHCLTVFGMPGTLPSDDDPVMCLTWGQFVDEEKYKEYVERSGQEHPGYFGPRAGIMELLRKLDATWQGIDQYSPQTVRYRQVTYAPTTDTDLRFLWLESSPEDVAKGLYPVGEAGQTDFLPDAWGLALTTS